MWASFADYVKALIREHLLLGVALGTALGVADHFVHGGLFVGPDTVPILLVAFILSNIRAYHALRAKLLSTEADQDRITAERDRLANLSNRPQLITHNYYYGWTGIPGSAPAAAPPPPIAPPLAPGALPAGQGDPPVPPAEPVPAPPAPLDHPVPPPPAALADAAAPAAEPQAPNEPAEGAPQNAPAPVDPVDPELH